MLLIEIAAGCLILLACARLALVFVEAASETDWPDWFPGLALLIAGMGAGMILASLRGYFNY